MLLRSLCAVAFFAVAMCDPLKEPSEEDKLKCFESYLHSKNLFPANVSESNNCDEIIKDGISADYTTIVDKLEQELGRTATKCVVAHAKKLGLHLASMKIYVYKHTNKVGPLERIVGQNDAVIEKAEIIDAAADQCGAEKMFEVLYTLPKNASKVYLELEYCTRKHLLDKGWIKATVNLNPTNLDVSGLNCETIIEDDLQDTLRNTIAGYPKKPSKKAIECIDLAFHILHYFDFYGMTILMTEFELSEEEKEAEKRKFTDMLVKFFKASKDCRERY